MNNSQLYNSSGESFQTAAIPVDVEYFTKFIGDFCFHNIQILGLVCKSWHTYFNQTTLIKSIESKHSCRGMCFHAPNFEGRIAYEKHKIGEPYPLFQYSVDLAPLWNVFDNDLNTFNKSKLVWASYTGKYLQLALCHAIINASFSFMHKFLTSDNIHRSFDLKRGYYLKEEDFGFLLPERYKLIRKVMPMYPNISNTKRTIFNESESSAYHEYRMIKYIYIDKYWK